MTGSTIKKGMRQRISTLLATALLATGFTAIGAVTETSVAGAAQATCATPATYSTMPAMTDAKWQAVRSNTGAKLIDPAADLSGGANNSSLDLFAAAGDSVVDWYSDGNRTMFRIQLAASAAYTNGNSNGIQNQIWVAALGKMVNGAPSTLAWVGVNGGGSGAARTFIYNPKAASQPWFDMVDCTSGANNNSVWAASSTVSGVTKNYIAFQVPSSELTTLGAASGVGVFVGTSSANTYNSINKDSINSLGSGTTPSYSSLQSVNTSANLTTISAPTISSFTPTGGDVLGGTQVTITGTNLDNLSTVTFGSASAQIVSSTSTSVTVIAPPSPITSPANGVGNVLIKATNVAGFGDSPSNFTYSASLTPTSIALASPGTLVTGEIKTLSATVKDSGGTTTLTAASGAIIFKDQNGTPLCPPETIVNGTATCSFMPITVSAITVTATYGGDATYKGSLASSGSITPSKGATKVIFTAPSAPADGAVVNITSKVYNSTGQVLLDSVTGSVVYSTNTPANANICTASSTAISTTTAASGVSGIGILVSGTADCTWYHVSGAAIVTASYSGDNNFLASSTASSTGAAQLATPVISSTSVTGSAITVNFGAITNRVSYIVRAYDSNGIVLMSSAVGTTTSLTIDTGISPVTPYKVTVQALGDGTNYTDSPESSATSVTTAVQSLPVPVVVLSGTAGSTTATITFGTSPNAASMTASLSPSGGTVPAVLKTDTTTTLSGLTPGTTYTYSLTAIGDGTTYSSSNAGTVTFTTATLQLTTPTITYVSASTTATSMTFDLTGKDANASSFRVRVYDNTNAEITARATTAAAADTSVTVTGLTPSTAYTFKVYAVGNVTNYTDSALSTAVGPYTTSAAAILATPSIALSTVTATSIALDITGVANATSYKVTVFSGAGTAITSLDVAGIAANATSVTMTGLTPGTAYIFKITAYTTTVGYTTSAASSGTASQTTLTLQLTTPGLTYGSATATSMTFSLTGKDANASSYLVRVYDTANAEITALATTAAAAATSVTVSGLDPSTQYKFAIYAVGNVTNYTDSALSTAVGPHATSAASALSTPSISLGTVTATTIALTITGVANATSYKVTVFNSSNSALTSLDSGSIASNATSVTMSGLTPGTSYIFKITAYTTNAAYSTSNASAGVTGLTLAQKLATPGITYASNTSSSITFNISLATPNVTTYKLLVFNSTGTALTSLDVSGILSSATTATATGLSPGASYKFQLVAIGDVTHYSDSDASTLTASQATQKAELAKPVVTLAPGTQAHTFIVTVTPVAHTNAYNFTLYEAGGASVDATETWDGASATVSHTFTNVTENKVLTSTVTPVPSDTNAYVAHATDSVNVTVDSLRTMTPTLGSVIQTADGYKLPLTNYSAAFDYTATSSAGTVTITQVSGVDYLLVTGLDSGAASVITLSWHRAGYNNGSQVLSSQSALNSSAKQILALSLTVGGTANVATINEAAKTITVTVPYGTVVTALATSFTVSGHATLNISTAPQTSGFTQDYTNSVTLTVVAQDGTTQNYTVTVTFAAQGATTLAAPTWTSDSTLITSTSTTVDLVFVGVVGASSYTIKVFDGATLAQSITNILSTATTQQVTGLSPNKSYNFVIIAVGNGSTLLTSVDSATLTKATTKRNIATPTVATTPGTTHDALVVDITPVPGATNYRIVVVEANGATTTIDVVALSSSTFSTTIAGINANKQLTITVTPIPDDAVNSDASSAAANQNPALLTFVPTLAAPVSTADGFTVEITNYAASFDWSVSTTSGVATITHSGSQWFVTVTGLSASGAATVTLTSARAGYADGSGTASGTATASSTPIVVTPPGNSGNNNSNNNNSNSTPDPEPVKDKGPKVNLDPKTPAAVIPLPENSGLKSGQSKIEEGGKEVVVKIAPNNAKSAMEITASDWTLAIKPANPANSQVAPVGDTGGLNIVLGSKVDVSGTRFAPNSVVKVYIFSEPTLLGEFQTDANGDFTVQVTVPGSLGSGEHTLQINGLGLNNNLRSASVPVTAKNAVTKTKSLVVLFKGFSASIDAAATAKLAAFAKAVKAINLTMAVTSNGFAKKEVAYTKAAAVKLSKARAATVVSALKKSGVKGTFKVVANGYAPENTAYARRVDVTATWQIFE